MYQYSYFLLKYQPRNEAKKGSRRGKSEKLDLIMAISDTAEYGALTKGKLVITEESRQGMKEILERIQDGSFATEWLLENQAGAPRFRAVRRQNEEHPLGRFVNE